MIILWRENAVRAQNEATKPEYPLAAETDVGDGDGAESEITFMASFIAFEQWSEMPQTYHFFPGEARVITSFPLSKLVVSGVVHCWKSAALLNLWTLWELGVYLKTTMKIVIIKFHVIIVTKILVQNYFSSYYVKQLFKCMCQINALVPTHK